MADLRDKKCLILLKDAALGKSTTLKQEYESLKSANISAYFIDLKCISDTYMEFLVAKFILDSNLYNNFKNFMFDEYDKVLPSFVNTICWLLQVLF